jgi:hypothetical protein
MFDGAEPDWNKSSRSAKPLSTSGTLSQLKAAVSQSLTLVLTTEPADDAEVWDRRRNCGDF